MELSTFFYKTGAIVVMGGAGIAGSVSLLLFLAFLYGGAPGWIKLDPGGPGNLVLNGALSFLFFLQHSGMIRRSFRKSLSKFVPSHYQGALYTLASGAVLTAFVVFWQPSNTVVLEAGGPLKYFLRALFFLSLLGMLWGVWTLRPVDMFGLDPILRKIRTIPVTKPPFIIRGPYRWVRHPLYLFMIVQFWSCPKLTTDRLLFNVLWTAWVVAATVLEERDLADDFGEAYRHYQAKVPMLLPRTFRASYPK